MKERPKATVNPRLGAGGRPSRPSWQAFSRAFRRTWAQSANGNANGHVSIFAPTRGGKTLLAMRGLLPVAPADRVLVVDVKGGDPNITGFGRPIRHMPARLPLANQIADDERRKRIHLQPQPGEAQEAVASALQRVWAERGWTVYVDEVRLVSDYLGLRNMLDRLWLFAGSRRVQLIAGTQAPRYVPTAMYDQAGHFLIGRVRDQRVLRRFAEILSDVDGADRILRDLGEHEFLYTGPAGLAIVRYPLGGGRGNG